MIAVQYMSSMGDDDLVVDAARVSFDKQAENFGPRQNERLINFLAKEKHTAAFTHRTVSFRCKAPIFMARQLAKHQVGGTWTVIHNPFRIGNRKASSARGSGFILVLLFSGFDCGLPSYLPHIRGVSA